MDSVAAVPAQTPREISKLQPKGGVGWGGVGQKEIKSLGLWPAADRLWPRWRTMSPF